MKSIVLQEVGGSLRVEERDRPEPGRDEVLIEVEACGVCHSDLHLKQGDFPMAEFPVVPGHEVAGRIVEQGADVEWPEEETRVGMPWRFTSCGHCDLCLSGREIMCANGRVTGVTDDGGYQEYMLAPAQDVTPIPDGMDPVEAAPLMCAGVTVFNALRNGEFQPGDQVAVIGLGGLGHLAVQYATAMGGRVTVLSTSPDKEDFARSLGAEQFLLSQDNDVAEALQDWDGGADLILSTAPNSSVNSQAASGLAPDGRLVLIGVTTEPIEVNPMEMIVGRRRVLGSPAGGRAALRDTLAFSSDHDVVPDTITFSLEEVEDVFDALQDGSITGRAVLVP